MLETLARRFREIAPAADFVSLRFMQHASEQLAVVRGIVRPLRVSESAGAMLTVHDRGGLGYAATSDLSAAGLRMAAKQALAWAHRTAGNSVIDFSRLAQPAQSGEYRSDVRKPWASMPRADKLALLAQACAASRLSPEIVMWSASLAHRTTETLLLTSTGARVHQQFEQVSPALSVTANRGAQSQSRRKGLLRQGGLELLDEFRMLERAPELGAQAIALLSAPNCPSGRMDVVLAPDQMVLQIHESIGHPLEIDRVLGDERNYAGTTFVTEQMFGSYRYGSELLNISFDPTCKGELASYGWDDEGQPARKELLIDKGILKRGLGGLVSQARSGLPGVANARACSWNRPPIDRMANLNLEPGDQRFDALVSGVENGVYMESNCSWSIDDSRNKFQFGCELGRLIRDGQLGPLVKNPNYRGVSGTFWRSLAGVGDESTYTVSGAGSCGKGEPNQGINVGHAAPACLFSNVDVFGGA